MDQKFAYAGIGARNTPEDILPYMVGAAQQLEAFGLILRSGAAEGADAAFEAGVRDPENKEIYLPWRRFNDHPSSYHAPLDEAYHIAALHHPAWERLGPGTKRLMARNIHQILGPSLKDPSKFVLCWTKGGQTIGGTGQAIRLAESLGVPVFNMGSSSLQEITSKIEMILVKEGILGG